MAVDPGARHRHGKNAGTPTTSTFDGTVFRHVIGNFMSGVVVITTEDEGRPHGMTVSAISSLSLEPPLLLVCLNANSRTQEAIHRTGTFAVNILAEHQGDVAKWFAQPHDDKFAGVAARPGRTGVPVLADALAVVECRVAEVVAGGTHRVFVADVLHAEAREGSPLAYFRGRFGRLELAQDAEAYQRLRHLVLTRQVGPSQPLDERRLSERLGVPVSAVLYALTRLVGENLVLRESERGHVVAPLDVATSDDTNNAKLAMELGAADLTVGRVAAEQLAEFRRRAEATVPLIEDGHLVAVDGYIDANLRFHSYLIEMTGIGALVRAYQHLSIQELMTRALSAPLPVTTDLVADHLDLVDAYERADLTAVKEILRTHNERAKAVQRAGIEYAGGQL